MTDMHAPRILVLGATGMLGNAMLRFFADSEGYDVVGSARSAGGLRHLREDLRPKVRLGVDVENVDSLAKLLGEVRPDVVINCIGLVKQLADANDPLLALPINAMLPHRLSRLCKLANARLVHVSTDCVFDGRKGLYKEADTPDAVDLYGRSKQLGELHTDSHAITLRTSIIGHELASAHGLVGWFLAQTGPVRGFSKAVFSGLPTVELARVIRDFVLPHPELSGLYHVSADPIDKHSLLTLLAAAYERKTPITADEALVIDRSLDSSRFRAATGYQPPEWRQLVNTMRLFS